MNSEDFEQQLQNVLQNPNPRDAFYNLSDLYCIAAEEEREAIRANFPYSRDWEVPDHTSLAAHLLGEPHREARIRASIIALSFINDLESRDLLSRVCVIYHSIKSIGKDADGWFKYFADMASPFAASLLFRFASRKSEMKSLEAFLWETEVTEEDFVLNREHSAPPEQRITSCCAGRIDSMFLKQSGYIALVR